jgi:hypothetical protein
VEGSEIQHNWATPGRGGVDLASESCHHPSEQSHSIKQEENREGDNRTTSTVLRRAKCVDFVSTALLDFRLFLGLLLFIQDCREAHAV